MPSGFPDKDDFIQLAALNWHQYQRYQRRKAKGRQRKVLGALGLLALVSLVFIGALIVSGGIGYLRQGLPNVALLTSRTLPQETVFYDRHGQLLYRFTPGQRRSVVKLKDISPYMVKAVLAAEDHRFYDHGGFDTLGITRAILANTQVRGISQGGSTITQQLARLLYLDTSQTIERKTKEAILAADLEKFFTKDELIELYLNALPFGSNIYGVATASREFFGHAAVELSLGEAALLAALQKAPTRYFPFGGDRAALFERQRSGLDAMVRYGFITDAEAVAAKAERINFVNQGSLLLAPHFVFNALEDVRAAYGGLALEQGLAVTTTLEAALQKEVEQLVRDFVKTQAVSTGADNAAAVVIEAKTGNVLSLVGSADYTNPAFGAFNAALAERQPGSTLKPFVYALAFEDGILGPASTIIDEPIYFGDYTPRNFDGRYHGAVSVRNALIYSYNIPAMKTLNSVGVGRLAERLQRCGVNVSADAGLTLTIGGSAATLYDITAAYSAFANSGVCVPARSLLKVVDNEGGILLDRTNMPPGFGTATFSAKAVQKVNGILNDTKYIYGEYAALARNAAFRNVRLKTGTSDGPRDAWVIGFNDDLIVGVWLGNHDNSVMRENVLALSAATPLWLKIFLKAANFYEGI